MALIQTIMWFLIALVVLVAVHEFGHFYVARRCGVKVLRFSIGFGKILLRWTDRQGTEYALAAIPLGGYVKMLDEREGEVPEHELHRAFNRKNVWQRIAVVAAGPFANFLLAVVLFTALAIPGVRDAIPIVGHVEPNSVAEQAGLEPGQEILEVDGTPTPTWQRLHQQLLRRLGETGTISFTVRYPDSELRYVSEARLDSWLRGEDEPDPLAGLGLQLKIPENEAILGQVMPTSAAERAGLQAGDHIVAADGQDIPTWREWVQYVRERPDQEIDLLVERAGERIRLSVTPQAVEENGERFGQVGVSIQPQPWPEHMVRDYQYGPIEAFFAGVDRTWETSGFVLLSVKKLLVGEISTKNLSGPITIAKVAGSTADSGWKSFVGFVALLSVFLAVFNLLPIPVLDGGHLLYYFIEVIKGSPVSEQVQQVGYKIGLFLVLGLMILALYNDVMRL
ncbi:RIP metalloprotease RseP [Marinimicrobium sp. ABcell2]|uniref:RIP metalloprotease RseP n=1 Tax=Marinimicrobium sp. ABcell2 TaxID=3069751 RepID=UPI0027B4E218|nr:RIP metalloprotease RseP [Marinimicrobium sp. ABcell2]MDQ2075331.1 RIP metalloprotease RseP [Marinimicrobium sp. ABcell2]